MYAKTLDQDGLGDCRRVQSRVCSGCTARNQRHRQLAGRPLVVNSRQKESPMAKTIEKAEKNDRADKAERKPAPEPIPQSAHPHNAARDSALSRAVQQIEK